MLQRIAVRLTKAATWPKVGLLLVAYVVLVSLLTAAEGRIKALSGGLGVPNLMFFFTPDTLYARLATFGDQGRHLYFGAELLDLVYPLVYTAAIASILALTVRRRFGDESRLLVLCLAPVAGMLCDYVENAGLFGVVLRWPERQTMAAAVATVGNWTKWSLLGPSILLALVALLDSAVYAVRRIFAGPAAPGR